MKLYHIAMGLLLICKCAFTQTVPEWNIIYYDETDNELGFTNVTLFDNLACADSEHYAAIGMGKLVYDYYVVSTSDGGQNWHETHFNFRDHLSPRAIVYPSKDMLIVAATLQSGTTEDVYLYKSTDAGLNWEEIKLYEEAREPEYTLGASHLNITMTDDNKGIIQANGIFVTDDGWASCKEMDLDYQGEIFVFGDTYLIANGFEIHASYNSGETWETRTDFPDRFYEFDFINENTGWAVSTASNGNNGQKRDIIYKTEDGGKNWTKQLDAAIEPIFGLHDVEFSDSLNGIAVGQANKILRTTDGGQSWVKELAPPHMHVLTFQKIEYPSNDLAVVVSFRSIIKYSGNEILKVPDISYQKGEGLLEYSLSWNSIEGAEYYEVQLAMEETDSFLEIFIFDEPNKIVMKKDGLTETSLDISEYTDYNSEVYFRIRAYSNDMSSQWSVAQRFMTAEDPNINGLDFPTLLTPADKATKQDTVILFTWSSVPEAEMYDLKIIEEVSSTGKSYNDITDTFKLVTGLKKNTSYQWNVRARNHQSGISEYSGKFIFLTTKDYVSVDENLVKYDLNVFPNPAVNSVRLSYHLEQGCNTDLALYNCNGEKVMELNTGFKTAGSFSEQLDLTGLSSGNYILICSFGKKNVATQLIINK